MKKYSYYVVTANAVKAPSFEKLLDSGIEFMGFDVVPTPDDGFMIRYCTWACSVDSVMAAFHKRYHDLHLRVIKDSIDLQIYDSKNTMILSFASFTEEYCINVANLFELAGFDVRYYFNVKYYNDFVTITATTDQQKQIMDNLRISIE